MLDGTADVEALEQVAAVAEDVAHVRVGDAVEAAVEAGEVERGREVVARVVAVARHEIVERQHAALRDEHGEDHLVGDDDVPRRRLLAVRPLGLVPEIGQEAESDLYLDTALGGEAGDRPLDVAEIGNVLAEQADPLHHVAVSCTGGSGSPSTSSSTVLTCQRPRLAASSVRPRKATFVG